MVEAVTVRHRGASRLLPINPRISLSPRTGVRGQAAAVRFEASSRSQRCRRELGAAGLALHDPEGLAAPTHLLIDCRRTTMDRTSKTVRRMDRPETRYVKVSEAYVAYQVFGDGPLDLLYFHGLGSHFEHFWDLPMYAQLLGRLADFSRVIIFDRRGTGGSDDVPLAATPTWEEWTQDVRAVLDAAGSNRTAIVAAGDAGPIAILFAAMNPGRVSALVLFNSSSRTSSPTTTPSG